jgi:glucokinase
VSLRIGIDIGGTKVLAGVVEDGEVVRVAMAETPGRAVPVVEVERVLADVVRRVADGDEVASVGLAAAGFVDATRHRVAFAPHLPWRGDDVVSTLSARLGCPVALDNDANCAALAESELGAARGAGSALLVTLGTGIGGALLVGGQLWRGAGGMAGEFGHAQVVPGGRPCECGQVGCWEQYCSGNALRRAAPGVPDGPAITMAALAGDPSALAAYAEVGGWLGIGLANLVAALDPELIVIGGGVSAAGDLLLQRAREMLATRLVGGPFRTVPDVVAASLGPRAGMIGATLLG